MFKVQVQHEKFNSVCGLTSDRAPRRRSLIVRTLSFVALAVAACFLGASTTAWATSNRTQRAGPQGSSSAGKTCPATHQIEDTLNRDAADLLRALADLHCDPRVSLLLAGALENENDLRSAEETLQRAHAVWPSNNSIAVSLARQYLYEGKTNQAVLALRNFRATASTPLQEMNAAVYVLLAGHQLLLAQTVANTAYATYPSVNSLLQLANTLQLQGRFKEVVKLLGSKRETYSTSPAFLITLAESEYDSILYDTARRDLEKAVSLNPDLYQAHFLLGNVLRKMSDLEGSITEYRIAIKLAPNEPRIYYQLALALQAQQDQAGAQSLLAQALSIDEHYAPAHVEMGKILTAQHHLADAVLQLKDAIQDNPDAEEAYYLLARTYAQLGDMEQSDAMAKELVVVRKKNSDTSNRLTSLQPINPENKQP
jgi:tetratricopeptide (TPR) repeat protein